MATVELSVRSQTATITKIGSMWKAAIDHYEEITIVKFESLTEATNVDEILHEIHREETKFKGYRYDGSKSDKFRSLVSKSLGPVEKVGSIVALVALSSFPPTTAIFTSAANSVLADYDKIAGLFEDLDLYLN